MIEPTTIEPIEPPTIIRKDVPVNGRLRTTESELRDLDKQILRHLSEPQRPVVVAQQINVATHRVATRIRVLAKRGQVERIRPFSGPNNGPGASLYRAIPA